MQEWLIELGLGSEVTTDDWAVFFSSEPPEPSRSITVYDTPGIGFQGSLNLAEPTLFQTGLQIRVRAPTYVEAWEKLRAITQTVILKTTDILDSMPFHAVFSAGSPTSLGKDKNDRDLLVQNFRVTLQPDSILVDESS